MVLLRIFSYIRYFLILGNFFLLLDSSLCRVPSQTRMPKSPRTVHIAQLNSTLHTIAAKLYTRNQHLPLADRVLKPPLVTDLDLSRMFLPPESGYEVRVARMEMETSRTRGVCPLSLSGVQAWLAILGYGPRLLYISHLQQLERP